MKASRWATLVWLVVVALSVLAAAFGFWRGDIPGGVAALLSIAIPTAGVVVARHAPRNPVGWSLLTGGVFGALGTFGVEYVPLALERGWLPWFSRVCAWLTGVTWVLSLAAALVVTAYYFPDGRLVSRRLRPCVLLTFVLTGLWVPLYTAMTWGVSAAMIMSDDAPDPSGLRGLVFLVAEIVVLGLGVSALVALGSLAVRWRRADRVVRTQLRWVFAALIVVAASLVGSATIDYGDWQNTIEILAGDLVAVATGVAVLRYRLYEIDRIVSRTVTYGASLVLLAGVYAGIVIGIGALVPSDLGSLGVAVATLVVVMAFLPLTRRIRDAVDKRFNRSRVDREQIVRAFADERRRDVDPDLTGGALLAATYRTVEPAHANLWLVPR